MKLSMRVTVFATCCSLLPGVGFAQQAETVYKRALPSVMTLRVRTKDAKSMIGTAFLALRDGCAVTAWHVVEDAESVTARFSDGQEFEVSGLIDKDEDRDVALIRVKVADRPLPPLAAGDPAVGSKVFVLGAPRGLDFSFTDGIISQVRQSEKMKLYQYSAETNPGNSGGPLLNVNGEVLGIISWKLRETQNVNFAVPSTYAKGLDTSLATQTWASVHGGTTADHPTAESQPSSEALIRLAAEWTTDVEKPRLEWTIWFNKQANPSSRESASSAIDKVYLYAGKFRDAALSIGAVPMWARTSEGTERIKNLTDSIGELASAESNALIKAETSDKASLEAANREMQLQSTRVFTLLISCIDAVKAAPWFNWGKFRDQISPSSLFNLYLPTLDGVLPDPVFEDRCFVGKSKDSVLEPGDVIIGVRNPGEDSFIETRNWKDLVDFLLRFKSEFVEVNVGSQDSPKVRRIRVERGK